MPSPPIPDSRLAQIRNLWGVEEVQDWLTLCGSGLEQVKARFREHGITGRDLLVLNDQKLLAIGLSEERAARILSFIHGPQLFKPVPLHERLQPSASARRSAAAAASSSSSHSHPGPQDSYLAQTRQQAAEQNFFL